MLFQQQPDESFLGMSRCHFGCHEFQCCSYSTSFDKTLEKVLICNQVATSTLIICRYFFLIIGRKFCIIESFQIKDTTSTIKYCIGNNYILLEMKIWILNIPSLRGWISSVSVKLGHYHEIKWEQLLKSILTGTGEKFNCVLN